MRLRRTDLDQPGYSRRRRGSGFSYHDQAGQPIHDDRVLARIRGLAIPPAWREVWMCADPAGHIQAVGRDTADRRQYIYHKQWRATRDNAKFDHVLAVAHRLPALRTCVRNDLTGRTLNQQRVLATVVRLLELGCFRIGGQEYARGEHASFGISTLRRGHVRTHNDTLEFQFPAKGGIPRKVRITDQPTSRVVRALLRQPTGDPQLFCYRTGRDRWTPVHSDNVNEYLRDRSGTDLTAKDFRTWYATVRTAVALAGVPANGVNARQRACRRAYHEVAEYLGNTPAVARRSYVDPRVVTLFHQGITVEPTLHDLTDPKVRDRAEDAVRELLVTGHPPRQ